MEIEFQMATVESVDLAQRTITYKSSVDSSLHEIQFDLPRQSQAVPIKDQHILIANTFETGWRHVAIFGDIPIIDQSKRPLSMGDHMIESSGGSYMHVDSGGNVHITDGRAGNFMQMLVGTKLTIHGTKIEITVPTVGSITMDPIKQEIRVAKITGVIETASVSVTDTNIAISAAQTVTIGRPIVPGQTPSPTGGAVLSYSGIPGDYSIDSLGRLVPGSSSVKVTT